MISNKDFIGKKYNDWEVIDWVKTKKGIEWICKCKCGTIKQHKVDNIKNNRSRMCKKCYMETRKKEKIPKEERILKIRYNNHLNWTEDNTFIGTYKEFLNECKKRKEYNKLQQEKEKEQQKEEFENSFIGMKYNKLTVIEIIRQKGGLKWKCRCDCGNEYINYAKHIKNGQFKSCGCISKEKINNRIYDKRIYKIYHSMKERCYNKNNPAYKNYGGRGIRMCKEWKDNPREFIKWAYETGYDENAKRGVCTIDRIDNNGNYEPSNCRWARMKQQQNNKRPRICKKYRILDKELTLKEINEIYNISSNLFVYRINHGMTNEEAVTIPRRKRKVNFE